MTAKKRKSLDDALAREFVYGESALREGFPPQATVIAQAVARDERHPKGESAESKNFDVQDKQLPELLPTVKSTPIQEPTKPSIMSQLQQPSKEPTIRLTVDLPESMHRKLSVLAAKTSRKKVEIVRLLLDEALKDVED